MEGLTMSGTRQIEVKASVNGITAVATIQATENTSSKEIALLERETESRLKQVAASVADSIEAAGFPVGTFTGYIRQPSTDG